MTTKKATPKKKEPKAKKVTEKIEVTGVVKGSDIAKTVKRNEPKEPKVIKPMVIETITAGKNVKAPFKEKHEYVNVPNDETLIHVTFLLEYEYGPKIWHKGEMAWLKPWQYRMLSFRGIVKAAK
jgi:hypothetical protein